MNKFRRLRADEIEVRVGTVSKNEKGFQLLLYKDARVDQNILDETVGPMNWKKDYQLIDGQLFCTIYIWDEEKKEWISKQDVGVESKTEEQKGRASDAQKRAGFAFGIGRELYTTPFIWIGIHSMKDEKFSVKSIAYDEVGNITDLVIVLSKTGDVVWSNVKAVTSKPQKKNAPKPSPEVEEAQLKAKVIGYINRNIQKGFMSTDDIEKLCKYFKVNSLQELTKQHCEFYIKSIQSKGGNIDE